MRPGGRLTTALLATLSASCALTMSFGAYDDDDGPRHSVSGLVSGLDGARVVIALNGSPLEVGDGPFTFQRRLLEGDRYLVAVTQEPPLHFCSVENGTGTIAGTDVDDVNVRCPSAEARLASIDLGAPLAPAFSPDHYAYEARFAGCGIVSRTCRIDAKVTAVSSTATIEVVDSTFHRGTGSVTWSHEATAEPVVADVDAGGRFELSGPPGSGSQTTPKRSGFEVKVTAPRDRQTATYKVVTSSQPAEYFKGSRSQAGGAFGHSVAMTDDTLLVGAAGEPGGAAYVFRRSANAWLEEARLASPASQPKTMFGAAVALARNGRVLAVAAPEVSSVYLYRRNGGSWVPAGQVVGAPGFGRSIALAVETLVVADTDGVVSADPSNDGTYVSWKRFSSRSGIVAADGTRVAVAWPGGVDVFRSPDQWTHSGPPFGLEVSLPHPSDTGGFVSASVAIDGERLAVGVSSLPNLDKGAALLYALSVGSWSLETSVESPWSGSSQRFGAAVALAGDWLVIGDPGDFGRATMPGPDGQRLVVSHSGSAGIFKHGTRTWTYVRQIAPTTVIPDASQQGGAFGSALAIAGGHAVVGAPYESSAARTVGGDEANISAPASGAAYWF